MAIRTDTYIVSEMGTIDVVWAGILNADSGAPITLLANFWKLTVQTVGTFGASGAVALQGSNDGVNWSTLKDVNNAAVLMIDTSIWRVEAISKFLRVLSTVGDGTTSLTVSLHAVQG